MKRIILGNAHTKEKLEIKLIRAQLEKLKADGYR